MIIFSSHEKVSISFFNIKMMKFHLYMSTEISGEGLFINQKLLEHLSSVLYPRRYVYCWTRFLGLSYNCVQVARQL